MAGLRCVYPASGESLGWTPAPRCRLSICRTDLGLPFLLFNEPATTEIYTLSLHDALPIRIGLGQAAVLVGHAGASLARGASVDLRGRLLEERVGHRLTGPASLLDARPHHLPVALPERGQLHASLRVGVHGQVPARVDVVEVQAVVLRLALLGRVPEHLVPDSRLGRHGGAAGQADQGHRGDEDRRVAHARLPLYVGWAGGGQARPPAGSALPRGSGAGRSPGVAVDDD